MLIELRSKGEKLFSPSPRRHPRMTDGSHRHRTFIKLLALAMVAGATVAVAFASTASVAPVAGPEPVAQPVGTQTPQAQAAPIASVPIGEGACDAYSSIVTSADLDAHVTLNTTAGETVNLTTADVAAAAAALEARGDQPFTANENLTQAPVDADRMFTLLALKCDETPRRTATPVGPFGDDTGIDADEEPPRSLLEHSPDEFFGNGLF